MKAGGFFSSLPDLVHQTFLCFTKTDSVARESFWLRGRLQRLVTVYESTRFRVFDRLWVMRTGGGEVWGWGMVKPRDFVCRTVIACIVHHSIACSLQIIEQ
jgi:hypothetical protein